MFGLGLFNLYLGFLVFGLGYAVIVNLVGAIGDHGGDGGDGGDGGEGDFHGDFHVDHSGDIAGHHSDFHGGDVISPFSPLMIATFSTLFGGLGFITLGLLGLVPLVPTSLINIVSLISSAVLAVIFSSYFSYFLIRLFVKSQTRSEISTSQLIGRDAEVTLTIEPGKIGEIAYSLGGSRQVNMARLEKGFPAVKTGQMVEIVSINEEGAVVKPAATDKSDS